MNSRTTGFTLVELLVVIGIVAILLGILVPTVARARAQAVTVQCASNLRQLYVAANFYADSSNGQLPTVDFGGVRTAWISRLTPFLTKAGQPADALTHCPAAPTEGMTSAIQYLPPTMSYGVNSFISLPHWASRRNAHMNTARFIMMADKAMSYDDWAISEDGGYYAGDAPDVIGATVRIESHRGASSRRHGNGRLANALMFDGHVSTLSAAELRLNAGHWHPDYEMQTILLPACPCCPPN